MYVLFAYVLVGKFAFEADPELFEYNDLGEPVSFRGLPLTCPLECPNGTIEMRRIEEA